jgi:hypothetical protein
MLFFQLQMGKLSHREVTTPVKCRARIASQAGRLKRHSLHFSSRLLPPLDVLRGLWVEFKESKTFFPVLIFLSWLTSLILGKSPYP